MDTPFYVEEQKVSYSDGDHARPIKYTIESSADGVVAVTSNFGWAREICDALNREAHKDKPA